MADYPISNVPRRVQYVNSGVGPYAFTFAVLVQTDIAVYRGNTLLTLTTDYSVVINANGTGSITLVTAGTGNITIIGARAIQRSSDYTTGGDLFASTLNVDLDSQTIFSQQLAESINRTITVPVTDASTLNLQLPNSTVRANKLFGFDSSGAPSLSNTTVNQLDAAVSSFVNTTGNNAASILYTPSGSGAVQTNVQTKLRESISVKDFGAVGNGVADDSAAFQAAIDYAAAQAPTQPSIFVPAGDYVIGATLNVNNAIEFRGENFATNGTRIFATNALNAPMFNVTSKARFFSMSLVGSNNAANTNETLVTIGGANDVTFENMFFFNSYTGIKYTGSTPAFYNSYSNCTFTNTNFFFITIDNSSSAGVDLIMNHCRFLGNMVGGCWNFALGLGSIVASDIQISLSGGTPANAQYCYFGTPAPSYGGAQFANVVFEGGGADPANSSSVYLLGTALLPWKEMHFDNCLFTTGDSPALVVVFGNGITFTNCSFSSLNTTGIVHFAGGGSSQQNIIFSACTWQGTGTETCLKTLGNSVTTCYVSDSNWGGSGPFVDFTSISAGDSAQIKLTVLGGTVGSASEAILLSDYKNVQKNIQVVNSNYGPVQYAVYTGALDGSGNATITHGIASGNSRIVSVNSFWKGGSGEAFPLPTTSVDGTQIIVGGGGASSFGQNYRVYVGFVQQAVAW